MSVDDRANRTHKGTSGVRRSVKPALELLSRPDNGIFLMLRIDELRLGAVLRPMLSFAQRERPKHLIWYNR